MGEYVKEARCEAVSLLLHRQSELIEKNEDQVDSSHTGGVETEDQVDE